MKLMSARACSQSRHTCMFTETFPGLALGYCQALQLPLVSCLVVEAGLM